ncbi:unnamed protein product [Dracunculus medinensis]|uniref:GRIP domain-containing protein n=1 Tax=Dracunculus medinensis TaxID=318479 RepID=A0A0N4UBJ1_DRAME|nr:unnamed protein product [Dracunculus medinensis]
MSSNISSSANDLTEIAMVQPFTIKGSMPDIMQTREANKKLKADLFELKSKYYLLKQELPAIRDNKDIDFSEDYINMRVKLSEAEKERLNLKAEINELSEKLNSLITTRKMEKSEWNEEKQMIVAETNQLREQISDLKQKLCLKTVFELDLELARKPADDESHAESSISNVSLISESSGQLAKMHSIILRKQYDQEKAKLEFAKEIDSLKDKLSILELEVKEKDHQNDQMEKAYEEMKKEVYKLEEEIKKRDKAINALAKALDKKREANSILHQDGDAEIFLRDPYEKEMNEKVNITTTDLLSRSLVLSEDLANMKAKMSLFKSVCSKLFTKLSGTANFLQSLLAEFGATEKGHHFIDEINELRIDLDSSLSLVHEISKKIGETEVNVSDLKIYLERTVNCSMNEIEISQNLQEVKQDISDQKLITELAAVKKCLNEKELLWAQIEESLKKQCTYQEDQNTQLQQENSSLKQLDQRCRLECLNKNLVKHDEQIQLYKSISVVDELIKSLREELHRVTDNAKTIEEGRKKAETNCALFLCQKQKFEAKKMVKYREIVESMERRKSSSSSIQVQTEINIDWIASLEAEHQKLLLINICEQENKPGGATFQLFLAVRCSGSLGLLFLDSVEATFFVCESQSLLVLFRNQMVFSDSDLVNLFQQLLQMQNLYEKEVTELTSQLKNKNILLKHFTNKGSIMHCEPISLKQSGDDRIKSISQVDEKFEELDNGKESPFELYTGKELSSINFRRMSDSAHCCVQIFKKLIHHGVKRVDLETALGMARSLRSQLYILSKCSDNTESIKENVASSSERNSLKEENIRLQLALNDATELLKIAEGKLKIQPESKVICHRITEEISKIHDVLKNTKEILRFS